MIKLIDGKHIKINSDNLLLQEQNDGLYTVIINDFNLKSSKGDQLTATVSIPNCKLNDFWNTGTVNFTQQYPYGKKSEMWTIEITDEI